MASVYHLFEDAFSTDKDLILQYIKVGNNRYLRVLAAIRIQKNIRGFLARRAYKKTQWAVLTMQRFIRGWLQRFHLADLWHMHFDEISVRHYTNCAIKIQSLWRGYRLRKMANVKEIMENNERVRKQNEQIMKNMRDSIEAAKDPVSFANQELYAEQLIDTLFHRHHLLRTKLRSGVLSDPDTEEFSIIEKLLQSISWSKYVTRARKLYRQCYKATEEVPYRYTNKNLQKLEKIMRESKFLADQNFDCHMVKKGLAPKSFCSKAEKPPYEKSIFSSEKYQTPIKNITRKSDKKFNIGDKDFDLFTFKKAIEENEIPPYYLDFWFGKNCLLHNVAYL